MIPGFVNQKIVKLQFIGLLQGILVGEGLDPPETGRDENVPIYLETEGYPIKHTAQSLLC